MDPDTTSGITDIARIVGGGGLIAFAAAVWYELRQQRIERRASDERQDALLSAIREALAALLERERIRDTPPRGVRRVGVDDKDS
jgi:hypothetical protein